MSETLKERFERVRGSQEYKNMKEIPKETVEEVPQTENATVDENDLDELIDELEEEIRGEPEEVKSPSLFENLRPSFNRKKLNNGHAMRCRFQKLAGIARVSPAATLTIGDNKFELSQIPPWYDVLRYKICGFKYEVTCQC